MKIITIGGVPAVGKTYTSKLIAEQYKFLALEIEPLRWDFFNNNCEENLYKYTKHTKLLENENMREYYLRCTLYESRVPLKILIEWHKTTMKFINKKIYKIINEFRIIKTKEDYIKFCKKNEKLINYMPKFELLNKNYIICSHAFINTINFFEDERIKIDFTANKGILINRFKRRENITENKFEENIKLYFKSYEEVIKGDVSITLNTMDKRIMNKIRNLI